jgi:hypothetical protein
MLNVILLCVMMLNVMMLNVMMLNVIILNVMAPISCGLRFYEGFLSGTPPHPPTRGRMEGGHT